MTKQRITTVGDRELAMLLRGAAAPLGNTGTARAEALGVLPSTFSRWTTGRRSPTEVEIAALLARTGEYLPDINRFLESNRCLPGARAVALKAGRQHPGFVEHLSPASAVAEWITGPTTDTTLTLYGGAGKPHNYTPATVLMHEANLPTTGEFRLRAAHLRQLAKLATHPMVEVRIVPDVAVASSVGSFGLATFFDYPDLMYRQLPGAVLLHDDPDIVAAHRATMDGLAELAWTAEKSTELIQDVLRYQPKTTHEGR